VSLSPGSPHTDFRRQVPHVAHVNPVQLTQSGAPPRASSPQNQLQPPEGLQQSCVGEAGRNV
jgi:hypothetical protein